MNEAVFISDLHLHPDESAITERFYRFVTWASTNIHTVYILGDFFHVWAGDDTLDAWSHSIAERLAWLSTQGVTVYFMPGNRDFLLGEHFASLARITLIAEPTMITLGEERILLVHGDRYCTRDKGHQWLRRLTRNWFFSCVFLRLPFEFRKKLVSQVRERSQANRSKPASQMDVVPSVMLSHMQQFGVRVVVHGHTHKPGLTTHEVKGIVSRQYVLSDWDDEPLILCYNKATRFYFYRLSGGDNG